VVEGQGGRRCSNTDCRAARRCKGLRLGKQGENLSMPDSGARS
jgi:hypothetical protein